MENNIPTAEEFKNSFNKLNDSSIELVMIEFAKIHVEAALKEASKNALIKEENYKGSWTSEEVYVDDHTTATVDKDSILNAYSLENIK
jgi:hypothetical protein